MAAKVRAREGTAAQLPRGEASRVNAEFERAESTAADTEVPAVEYAEPEVEDDSGLPAEPADFEPQFEAETEDEDFITGPTSRPDEAQFVGATPTIPLSAAARRAVPILQRAAEEPGASEQLRRLVAYLLKSA